jgi:hypothetical protein
MDFTMVLDTHTHDTTHITDYYQLWSMPTTDQSGQQHIQKYHMRSVCLIGSDCDKWKSTSIVKDITKSLSSKLFTNIQFRTICFAVSYSKP